MYLGIAEIRKSGYAGIVFVSAWLVAATVAAAVLFRIPSAMEMTYGTDSLFRMAVLQFVLTMPLFLSVKGRLKWGATDVLLLCLAVAYVLSAVTDGSRTSLVSIQESLPYVLIYFSFKTFFSSGGNFSRMWIVMVLAVSLCVESVYGLMQVSGVKPSGHALFGMTGTFFNPGPFGGYVAILMSVSSAFLLRRFLNPAVCDDGGSGWRIWFCRLSYICAVPATLMGLMVLPASGSRAGWLAFSVSLLLFFSLETGVFNWMKRHRIVAVMSVLLVLVSAAGVFSLKRDSAMGRLHIWNIEMRAVASAPLLGYGPGTAPGAYGRAQERFFREHEDITGASAVAGCPEYAFNEYLRVGMESGLSGLAMAVALVAVSVASLYRCRSVLLYGLVAAAVFSFFSYPLSMPRIAVVIAVLLASAGCGGFMSAALSWLSVLCMLPVMICMGNVYNERSAAVSGWKDASRLSGLGFYEDAAAAMSLIYCEMSWNYRYLYDYGYALHKTGDFEMSSRVLSEGADISSDPMFHNIIGKNYEALGDCRHAEKEYLKAHYMVPSRIYPLSLLMDMMIRQGRDAEAVEIGEMVRGMYVNEKVIPMKRMQKECMAKLDSLKRICVMHWHQGKVTEILPDGLFMNVKTEAIIVVAAETRNAVRPGDLSTRYARSR